MENFEMIPGQGVKAKVDGKMVCAGNERLFQCEQIIVSEDIRQIALVQQNKGATIIYAANDDKNKIQFDIFHVIEFRSDYFGDDGNFESGHWCFGT
ncbi:MAG: hypothetical protein MR316_01375 [Lachnospiraceae bacterium]|nr:hypothetical protein [Lachnospiraceae bacterium]